jgi:flagellin-like protein
MKILKSKKALSPVVASIILIAVTVAVSLAVALWMGALTGGYTGTTSVMITKVTFVKSDGQPSQNIDLALKNTGTKTTTIVTVKVNGVEVAKNATLTLDPGKTGGLRLTLSSPWVAGDPYKFDLYDGGGQIIGSYQENAPSSSS